MRKLSIERPEYLPNLSQVESFEAENKIKLPSDFKEFILFQNPSEVKEAYFFVEGEDPYYLNGFFPFHSDLKGSLQNIFKELYDFYHGNYLAFSCDSGGWQYVISIQESDYGKVYFCRMDEELENALTLLADNFEEFINGLQKPPEEWQGT